LRSTLEKAGHPRQGEEAIERLAARLSDRQAAQLLQRYAALRYGDIGDAGLLEDDISTYARAFGRGSPG
jgi:hypothetical protein